MIIQRLLQSVRRFLRLILHFRRPGFDEIELFNLVIDQKPLLIISWKCRFPYLVMISAAKVSFQKKQGLQVVALPPGSTTVSVVVKSGWRLATYKFPLRPITVSEEVAAVFIKGLRPMALPGVNGFAANVATALAVSNPRPIILLPKVLANHKTITVNQFIYHKP